MTINFTVSPSFPNERISDWYIFNTWLQRAVDLPIHLELYSGFGAQREAIAAGKVDLIYANPFDASVLVRNKGFRALARPADRADELVIVASAEHPATRIADLPAGTRLSCTDDPGVNTIGRILLEPANLDDSNLVEHKRETYIQVAKDILRGEADIGFMPVEAFNGLSSLVKRDLKVLVTSELHVINHVLLGGPAVADKADAITAQLLSLHETEKGRRLLEGLGTPRWLAVPQEDVEFMIDIISTLGQ